MKWRSFTSPKTLSPSQVSSLLRASLKSSLKSLFVRLESCDSSPHLYHVHKTLLSLTCFSLSQQVSQVWCYGACWSPFSVLPTPSRLKQMATLPGSDGGFFLSTVTFLFPRTGDLIEKKFQCSLLVSWAGQLFKKNVLICFVWIVRWLTP